jgi:hypothetical protein
MRHLPTAMRVRVTLLLALILSYPLTVYAVPVSFDWGSFNSGGSTDFGVYDTDNATILQTGDLAQLIWTGADQQINPPGIGGAVSGDDVLLDTTTVENLGSLTPPMRNKGYILFKTSSFDSGDPWIGKGVYIRAWNAVTASVATAYGNSALATLTPMGQHNWPRWYTNESVPLSVNISYFTATSKPDHVLLAWETVSETDVIGFNLHRGASTDGPWQKLNAQPIPTSTPGGGGHAYTWVDATAVRGSSYYFRLDAVLTNGNSEPVGMTSIAHGVALGVWLPLMCR